MSVLSSPAPFDRAATDLLNSWQRPTCPSDSSGRSSLISVLLYRPVLRPLAVVVVCAAALSAQNPNSPVSIGNNETLFTTLTAINNCGFDAELANSEALRQTVRGEVGRALENSEAAKSAADSICAF